MLLNIKDNEIGQVVSARELYKFLGLTKRFSSWIEIYIKENNVYGFVKNEDFTPYLQVHPQNLQEIQDYLLTIDMAKELSMVSKSEKGRQARKYFIACEKKYVALLENKLEVLGTKFEIDSIKSNNSEWGIDSIKTNLSKAEIIENEIDRLVIQLKALYEQIEKISYQKSANFVETYHLFHNIEKEKTFCK